MASSMYDSIWNDILLWNGPVMHISVHRLRLQSPKCINSKNDKWIIKTLYVGLWGSNSNLAHFKWVSEWVIALFNAKWEIFFSYILMRTSYDEMIMKLSVAYYTKSLKQEYADKHATPFRHIILNRWSSALEGACKRLHHPCGLGF